MSSHLSLYLYRHTYIYIYTYVYIYIHRDLQKDAAAVLPAAPGQVARLRAASPQAAALVMELTGGLLGGSCNYLGAPYKAPLRSLGFLLGWYEAGSVLMNLPTPGLMGLRNYL